MTPENAAAYSGDGDNDCGTSNMPLTVEPVANVFEIALGYLVQFVRIFHRSGFQNVSAALTCGACPVCLPTWSQVRSPCP
jgi:hypothetical protein